MKRNPLNKRIRELCKDDHEYETAISLLPVVKRAIGGKGQIYARVETVSRSGMSRTISLAIVDKGEIFNLNFTVFAKIYGDSKGKWGVVKIGGCGMDMLFEATYRLYQFIFDQRTKPYQKHLVRYREF